MSDSAVYVACERCKSILPSTRSEGGAIYLGGPLAQNRSVASSWVASHISHSLAVIPSRQQADALTGDGFVFAIPPGE